MICCFSLFSIIVNWISVCFWLWFRHNKLFECANLGSGNLYRACLVAAPIQFSHPKHEKPEYSTSIETNLKKKTSKEINTSCCVLAYIQAFCLPSSCPGRTETKVINVFYKTQNVHIRLSSETPWDAVDLCLSFTSAGMSERDSFPVASENKSDRISLNSGQLHLLHVFVAVWLQCQSVTLKKDKFCIVQKWTKKFFYAFQHKG